MTLSLLIVEDHAVVSKGLQAMLEPIEGLKLVGSCPTGEAAIEHVRDGSVSVVLMDVNLAGAISGIEATRRIKQVSPSTKVLILTMYTDPATVAQAVEAGADGYLSKGTSPESLAKAIEDIAAGRSVLDPTVTEGVFGLIGGRGRSTLSDREVYVLQALSNGLATREVAQQMHLSEDTIKTYLRQIFRKLDVRDRTEAVAEGFRRGFIR